MAEQSTLDYYRYRIRRDIGGTLAWFAANWRERRWFRYGSILVGLAIAGLLAAWALLARDLPDVETLLEYETPLPTVVRGGDGEIVHSYARERRVQLQYVDFPTQLIEAYLAAEDKTFFSHGGVDLSGTANAVFDYASKMGSGERAVGGSTITQQYVKNWLIDVVDRDDVVLATKAGLGLRKGKLRVDTSRGRLLSTLDASLGRLGVYHVDLWQVHTWHDGVPLEETLSALLSASSRAFSWSKRRALRILRAFALFLCWLFSSWHWTTVPVGRCVMRIALSVLLTFCPPGPLA